MTRIRSLLLAAAACGLAAVALIYLLPDDESGVSRRVKGDYVPPPRTSREVPPIPFTDVTPQTGIRFTHVTGGFVKGDGGESRYLPECMGAGVLLFDPDNDGDADVLLVNSCEFEGHRTLEEPPVSRLFRNDGGLRFTDVTAPSGLGITCYGMGGAAADYDGDGRQDVLITSWGGLRLFRNLGDLRFEEVTSGSGLETPGWRDEEGHTGPDWSTGAAFFDADGDGDLDLFVANYVRWSPETDVYTSIDGRRKSFTIPTRYEGSTCRLFLNQGNGSFRDATKESGVYKPGSKALGVALWDFNDDGLMDVVVSCDQSPNLHYENKGGGRFEERGADTGIDYDENGMVRAGMGITAADYLNDGRAGVPIGNFSREPIALYRMQGPVFFRDVTQQAGIAAVSQVALTFGLLFADLDLDGYQDLVAANGHIEPHIQDVMSEITYAQPPLLLYNLGDGSFVKANEAAGDPFRRSVVARGLASADLDLDGDLDLVLSTNGGPPHILRNDQKTGHGSLRVRLVGRPPNTDALGARVLVRCADMEQQQIVRTGGSYLSQSELPRTFGLGGHDTAREVLVVWPDGTRQRLTDVPARSGEELVIRR